MGELETRIEQALALGISFKLVQPVGGTSAHDFFTLSVSTHWTNEEFMSHLEKKIQEVKRSTFLQILQKRKLI